MTRPKDHLIAAAVSEIARLGAECGTHQSFRQQVSQIVVPMVDGLAQQLAYHEARDGLLSQAQDEVARLRAELAEVQRPLDAQMARLNENLTAANARMMSLELDLAHAHEAADANVRDAERRIAELETKLNEVHSWIVCAAIASPDDMMQNAERIEEITRPRQ